jgi:hypothetical protein
MPIDAAEREITHPRVFQPFAEEAEVIAVGCRTTHRGTLSCDLLIYMIYWLAFMLGMQGFERNIGFTVLIQLFSDIK